MNLITFNWCGGTNWIVPVNLNRPFKMRIWIASETKEMNNTRSKILPLIHPIINSNDIHHCLWLRLNDKLSKITPFISRPISIIFDANNQHDNECDDQSIRIAKKNNNTNDELIFPCKITIDRVTNVEMMPSAKTSNQHSVLMMLPHDANAAPPITIYILLDNSHTNIQTGPFVVDFTFFNAKTNHSIHNDGNLCL